MKQKQFDEKIEFLIKEAIFKFKKYEEKHKELYSVYAEYDDPNTTKERRRELGKLMRDDINLYGEACDIITELGKQLNSHDMGIVLNRINKVKKNNIQLWEEYEQWKSTRSTNGSSVMFDS